MAQGYYFTEQRADPKHSKGKGAGKESLQLDKEQKSWFKSQLTALGIAKAQGKPWCCLEHVEMLFCPNQQSFKDISGLKSATVPGWDVTSEAEIILNDALQRGSKQLYIHTGLYAVLCSRMPETGHLPTRAPEIPRDKIESHCKRGCVWNCDSYIDT